MTDDKDKTICLNCGGSGFNKNNFTRHAFFWKECEYEELSDSEKIEVLNNALKWSVQTTFYILNSIPVTNLDEQTQYFERLIGEKIRE